MPVRRNRRMRRWQTEHYRAGAVHLYSVERGHVGKPDAVSDFDNCHQSEVLGASGSPGTYYITDQVSLSGVVSQATAGQLNLTR